MSMLQKAFLPVSSSLAGQFTTLAASGVAEVRANTNAMTLRNAPPHVVKFACFYLLLIRDVVAWWKWLSSRRFFGRACAAFPLFAFQRFVAGEQKKGGGQSKPAPSKPGQTKPEKEREKEQERVKKGKTRGQLVLESERGDRSGLPV